MNLVGIEQDGLTKVTVPPVWLPTSMLVVAAMLIGLSWLPLKAFAAAGIPGPLLSLLTFGSVGIAGLPWLLREHQQWRGQVRMLLLVALAGGWANAAFTNALMGGDVIRVTLLFYLAPVWSVLGGWLYLGESISRRRTAAVTIALVGVVLVVGGGAAFNGPPSIADLLALSGGVAFAGNNIASRAAQSIPMLSKTIVVFIGCGLSSLPLIFLLNPAGMALPTPTLGLGIALAAYAFGWLVLVTALWQYGVTHVEAGRSGVILIIELLVAMVSATLIGGAHLAPREWLGGAMIAAAGLLEAGDETVANQSE